MCVSNHGTPLTGLKESGWDGGGGVLCVSFHPTQDMVGDAVAFSGVPGTFVPSSCATGVRYLHVGFSVPSEESSISVLQ